MYENIFFNNLCRWYLVIAEHSELDQISLQLNLFTRSLSHVFLCFETTNFDLRLSLFYLP